VNDVAQSQEITLELLTDIATALRNVGRDLMPLVPFTVNVQRWPVPCVVLRVPGATNKPIEALLHELAMGCRKVTDATLPSLPLRYTEIGGSEAAGIEVTVRPAAEPVYGHVIKAKLAWLRPSETLRRQRPNLPERFIV
jgi:hypothetical protein